MNADSGLCSEADPGYHRSPVLFVVVSACAVVPADSHLRLTNLTILQRRTRPFGGKPTRVPEFSVLCWSVTLHDGCSFQGEHQVRHVILLYDVLPARRERDLHEQLLLQCLDDEYMGYELGPVHV